VNFKFNLFQINWFNSKWISIGLVETNKNWGALAHVCYLWDFKWELEFFYFGMFMRWAARRLHT
jgi:hypothetical protein